MIQALHSTKQTKFPLTINGLDKLGNQQEEFQASAESFFIDLKIPMELRSFNIHIKTSNTDENKIIEYEIVSEAFSENGQVIIGKDNNHDAMTALKNTIDKIETQHRRQKSPEISGRETVPMGRQTSE